MPVAQEDDDEAGEAGGAEEEEARHPGSAAAAAAAEAWAPAGAALSLPAWPSNYSLGAERGWGSSEEPGQGEEEEGALQGHGAGKGEEGWGEARAEMPRAKPSISPSIAQLSLTPSAPQHLLLLSFTM